MGKRLESTLNNIYTDLLMLQDESWQPDPMTCDASIESIEIIHKELVDLHIIPNTNTLTDTRG